MSLESFFNIKRSLLFPNENNFAQSLPYNLNAFSCSSDFIRYLHDLISLMGKSRSSEEKGHKAFQRDFGGKVFIVMPENGVVSKEIEKKIIAERDLLLKMPPKNI